MASFLSSLSAALAFAGVFLVSKMPLNAQTPATPSQKPTLFLIGDSTIKNGQDNGGLGQWGWGHILPYYFDATKITVENDAVGGTSSRTFMQTPSMWPRVLPKIRPGDFIIMQFGHNDGTAPPESDTTRWRSTLKGNGEEIVQGLIQSGGTETVHSFGWYLRQFVAQSREKGATPIICSLIPRNRWTTGKNNRNNQDYALWAQQAAQQTSTLFIPLNDLVADQYDLLGQDKVTATLFPQGEQVHPNWAGAKLNAQCVAAGIKALKDSPLKDFLAANPTVPPEPAPPPNRGRARGPATTTSSTTPAATQSGM